MKKMIYWSKTVVCWTMVAIASMEGTAFSQVQRVAQAFPGKCAMAKEDIFVYNEPATSGRRIRSMGPSEQVTLADEGMNGWIAIDSPIKGFVQITDLKPCSPIGECRAAKQGIFVYDGPDPSGRKIRSLLTNEEVTIASNNENGWIGISSPVNGFVQTADLKKCHEGDRSPGEKTGKCRRVTEVVESGLNIRALPNTSSDIIEAVSPGDIVIWKTSPPEVFSDAEGRKWVAIASPQEGWISEGFPDSDQKNLEAATCPR